MAIRATSSPARHLQTLLRVRAKTKVTSEAFAAKQLELQSLPAVPFEVLLKLERRVSHDDLVSLGGNYYIVPVRTRLVC